MQSPWKHAIRLTAALVVASVLMSVGFLAGYVMSQPNLAAPLSPIPTPRTSATVDASGDGVPEPSREEQFALFWEAWDLLQQEFYGELPPVPEAARGAVKGVVQSLGDPNTALIEPDLAKVFNEDISGQFEGIGAVVGTNEEGLFTIQQPYENSPASRAGLQPGDIVLEVDGQSVEGLNTMEIISLIRGPEGSTVTLVIYRPSTQERLTVPVTRAKIDIKTVETRMLDEGIGYVRLREFNGHAAAEVRSALRSILDEEPMGIIFDLRGDPGGLLDAAIRVGSEFVNQGNITEERFKDGTVVPYPALEGGLATDPSVPLVVLIDGGSASASEIVAGAIQDTGRGILVGEKTYGKGSVQIPHTLSDGSQLRITVAHWFTPSGRDIHTEGLSPDIEVPLTLEDYRAGRDPQLDRAIEAVQEMAGTTQTADAPAACVAFWPA